jgi:hypothetical protein
MSGISQHSPSISMSYTSSNAQNALRNSASGPLSPNVPTNPPPAHHYQPTRGRSGTFSQLDVPPALQKLGLDLGSFKSIGTPQLRRDDQRAAWERRHAGDASLDRRRSLKQANPHLEHLEYYAQGQPSGYYYTSPPSMQQPFSVVVDPRMVAEQQGAPSVTMPPPTYAGQGGQGRYAVPAGQQSAMSTGGSMSGMGMTGPINLGGSSAFDGFDSYDIRDGLSGMLHQPLVPTQQGQQRQGGSMNPGYYGAPSGMQQPQQQGHPGSYGAGQPNMPYPGQGQHQQNPSNGGNGAGSTPGGRQKRSDQQMWP